MIRVQKLSVKDTLSDIRLDFGHGNSIGLSFNRISEFIKNKKKFIFFIANIQNNANDRQWLSLKAKQSKLQILTWY